MTIFYICRHGETENNKNKRLSGWIDTPLTEEGDHNAVSAAAKLQGIHFDKVIASDAGRAFITAYLITRELGFSDEIERAKQLREVNYGDLANQPYAAYPEVTTEQNAALVMPDGESLVMMQERVLKYVRELAKTYQGQTILLVAHDGTINAVRASYANENIGVADLTHNPHDFVARFIIEHDRVTEYDEVA